MNCNSLTFMEEQVDILPLIRKCVSSIGMEGAESNNKSRIHRSVFHFDAGYFISPFVG